MGSGLYAQNYFRIRWTDRESIDEPEQLSVAQYRGKVQLSAVALQHALQDRTGATISRYMLGGQTEGFIRVWQHLEVGIAGAAARAADMKTHNLTDVKYRMAGGLVKWTVTPQTLPRLYVVFGMGYVWQQTRFLFYPQRQRADGAVLLAGAGLQLPVWKQLYLDVQWRLQRQQHPFNTFVLISPHTVQGVSLGVGYTF